MILAKINDAFVFINNHRNNKNKEKNGKTMQH